jgi:putative iron-regulated protein
MHYKTAFCHLSITFTSLGLLLSCRPKSSQDNPPLADYNSNNDRVLLAQFVDAVILPNYRDLAQSSADLELAVQKLNKEPTEDHFLVAQQAWVVARIPWEQEAYLFGPVDTKGFDSALDSWTLAHHRRLEEVITADARDTGIDLAAQDPNLKGLHVIEFILFGYEKAKTLLQLSFDKKSISSP